MFISVEKKQGRQHGEPVMLKLFVACGALVFLCVPKAHGQEGEGGPTKPAVAGEIRDQKAIQNWVRTCAAKPKSCDRHQYEVQGFLDVYELDASDPSSYENLKPGSPFRDHIVKVRKY
jgi:hypothetical protein